MSSVELVLAVDVDATPDATFEALVDWARQGEWMLGTTVKPTHAGGRGVGGRISAYTGLGPFGPLRGIGFTDTMEITAWDPPRRCDVVHTGKIVRGTGSFALEPLPTDRSRFVWRERIDLPLGAFGRLAWPLGRPLAKLGVKLSLDRFAAWVPTR